VTTIFEAARRPRKELDQRLFAVYFMLTFLAVFLVGIEVSSHVGWERLTSAWVPAAMLAPAYLVGRLWWRTGGYVQRITAETVEGGVRLSVNGPGRAPLETLDVPSGAQLGYGFGRMRGSNARMRRELAISHDGQSLTVWTDARPERALLDAMGAGLASVGLGFVWVTDDAESDAYYAEVEKAGEREDAEQQRAASAAVQLAVQSSDYAARGLHPLLGRRDDDAIAWARIRRVALILAGTGVPLAAGLVALPGLMSVSTSFVSRVAGPGLGTGAVSWLVGAVVFAGRSLVAARAGSPVYLIVGARGARLVRWGWPLRRASVPLIEGTIVRASQYSHAQSKAQPGDLNHWNVETTLPWLNSIAGSRSIGFATYYCVSPDGIAELRAALKAYGVTLKYRSSPAE
jgi:hypothetical protein